MEFNLGDFEESPAGEIEIRHEISEFYEGEEEILEKREYRAAKQVSVASFKKKYVEFDTCNSTLREGAVNTFYRDEIRAEVSLKEFDKKDASNAHNSQLCLKNVKKTATSFTCLDCGMNQNAIICNECFDVSRHIGHRVMKINRSGICDCGDINMWKKEGNCSKHTGN
jgi:Putative zinc finger in N-recognin (UBR box)